METTRENSSLNMEQELAGKVGELETQRQMRLGTMVDVTLRAIAEAVESRQEAILQAMSEKGAKHQSVRQEVIGEVVRAAEERLWCPEYDEKRGSSQRVRAYTGSHWEAVEPQRWKDFVADSARRCGVPESLLMNHSFMNPLAEGMAYNVARSRHRQVPPGEVWLNLTNGTLVLSADGSIRLRQHCKDDLFGYTLGYAYDAEADCPLWQAFLDRVLPEAESQQVLREFIGYCLMDGHRLEKMLLLYGEGLNGKSVTLELVECLLGAVNVSYLSLSDLTNDDVKRAAIEGKKLNISHESGRDVNPNVLKQLTSGEPVVIKHLYVDPRLMLDYGKLIAAFNQLPRAENTFGFFRRLIILPYEVTIPKEEIDRELPRKLKTEVSGILNWVLQALPALMARQEFTFSPKCEEALEHYRLKSDSVRLFVSEMCERSGYAVRGKELNDSYAEFCRDSGLRNLGKTRFFDRLESLGYKREMRGTVPYFNLRVTEP